MSLGLTESATKAIGREVQSGLVPLLDVLTVPLDRFGQGIDRLGQRLMDGFGQLTLLLGSINQVRFGIPVQVTNLGYLQTLTFGLLFLSLTAYLVLVLIFTRLGILSSQLWQLHVDIDLLHDDIVSLTIVTALFGALTVALLTAILGTLGKGLKVDGSVNVSITGLPEIDMLKLLELLGLAALGLALIVGFVAALAGVFSLFSVQALVAVFLVTSFLQQMTELLTLFNNSGWGMLAMAGGLAMIILFIWSLGKVLDNFTDKAVKLLEPLTKFLELLDKMATQMIALSIGGFAKLIVGLGVIAGFLFLVGLALDEMVPFAALQALQPLANLLKVLGELAEAAAHYGMFENIPTIAATFAAIGGLMLAIGSAFTNFTAINIKAIEPVKDLLETLGRLAKLGADFSRGDVGTLEDTFKAMGKLVEDVSAGLSKFNDVTIKAIEPLKGLLTALGDLATKVSAFNSDAVEAVQKVFEAMGTLVEKLGPALDKFSERSLRAIDPLKTLLAALGDLAVRVSTFGSDAVDAVKDTFKAMSGLVSDLVSALNDLSEDAINAITPMTRLIAALQSLAVALSSLAPDQVTALKDALGILIDFLKALGNVLDGLSEDALNAMPILTNLINALAAFATAIHNLTFLDLVYMGLMLAGVATFIGVVGEECMAALPGLEALSGVLEGINGILGTMATLGSAVATTIASIGDEAKSSSGWLSKLGIAVAAIGATAIVGPEVLPFFFQEGGMVEHTGPAIVHEGERVLSRGETQAFEGSVMAPPASASPVDQSINLGGVTINIHTDRLDANNADVLSETIVARLQEKLASLHTEQLFRTGVRAMA
jgi:methyl-accepting chemotaxis protein